YVIKTQGSRNNKRKWGNKNRSKSSPLEKKNKQERNQKKDPNHDEFPEVEFDCNVISGALGGGGDTVSARRRYLREVLSMLDRPRFKEDLAKTDPLLLYFTKEDMHGVLPGHVDGLVIAGTLVNCRVRKIFVDAGSCADIILWDAFKRMNLDEEDLKPCKTTLVAFNGEHTPPKGYIDLRLTLGTKEAFKSERVRFIVADFPSEYNIILGRPTIHQWDMLVSTKHQKIKMLSSKAKVITICGDQKESRGCYFDTVKDNEDGHTGPPRVHTGDKQGKKIVPQNSSKPVNVVELDMREEAAPRPEPNGELENLILEEDLGQYTRIDKSIDPKIKQVLADFLKSNTDVFAWKSSDIPGIDPAFCCHKLAAHPGSKPIAQKKRKLRPERMQVLQEHVKELLDVGFIRELQYTTWLVNVVMVKKPNGKWRICTDYTDLNKVCPKDAYPMPNIDQLVDNSAGFRLLSFIDAYSGYNQIPMYPADQEKTTFIAEKANYCYNVMPFGLKNSGATYQRMMNKVFEDQLGRNVEVYIDDMIVKSFDMMDHVKDLEQTFQKLRKYRIRLNPVKCAFGVAAKFFLGFMLTHRGIEANPDKCKAILDMKSPRSKKEVQQLTGRLAALTRFLPKSAKNALPFFKLLKKEATDGCNPACEAAFEMVKKCLATPPVLSKQNPGEILILYLAVGEEAISAVLIKETNDGQEPIYFVSRALQGAEVRYQKLEKVAFALLVMARRLRPYFQGHQIVVRTNQPIRQVLHKPDLAGRMTNWAIELSEYDITYESRKAIKSQVLADFIMELTPVNSKHEKAGDTWKVYVDGSSNSRGSEARIILESPEGVTIEHSLNLGFPTSNNQAEYETLIAGLVQAKENGARKVQIFSDSQLVTSQIERKYQVKGPLLMKYLSRVQEIMTDFDEARVTHIPRGENSRADILSKLASTKNPVEHPQSKGHAEAANKVIAEGLKKRMFDAKESWVRQLYFVLWGYRTSTQTATGETPYRLTYGCEAMIPVEIGEPSWRKLNNLEQGEQQNSKMLTEELHLVDEARVTAHCRNMMAKQQTAAKYNKKVRPRNFEKNDLVLRRADIGNKNAKDGKLAANWEGPYRVREKLRRGAYILETVEGKEVKRT
ncbi:uncharacterized protein LOC133306646, partial [Gastrolobium bilobum]|uniref:uncharacterized protein LOC133306646 n=1 Tax=Gastrolobium bilobum TaxID=150636 RepID=UPI002AAF8E80